MSAVPGAQWGRRCSLLLLPRNTSAAQNNPSAYVAPNNEALELSDMHITFTVRQEDEESPNNATIRVENLAAETAQRVQDEFGTVILQAGYWGSAFGVVFKGQVKQFRKGRSDAKTTYLDILAADGDLAYNWAVVNQTLSARSTPEQRVNAIVSAMAPKGLLPGQVKIPSTGGVLPRGKVLFGLAKSALREVVRDRGCTWSIQNGRVNVVPLDGYLDSEAVVLNAATGLIGRAEATMDGVRARCLINPRIQVGALVNLDNSALNQTVQAPDFALSAGQQPFDRYAGVQMFADVAADGLYRVYVAELTGDTRGQEWYMDLTLLALDPATGKVKAG